MKTFALGLVAIVMMAGTAQAQNVGGRYRVDGTNFDGSRYGGTATIDVTSSNTCRIRWDVGTTSQGICMVNGNSFAAAYVFNSGVTGLVLYDVLPDGRLQGRWTIADTEGFGTEVLTPMR